MRDTILTMLLIGVFWMSKEWMTQKLLWKQFQIHILHKPRQSKHRQPQFATQLKEQIKLKKDAISEAGSSFWNGVADIDEGRRIFTDLKFVVPSASENAMKFVL